MKTTSELVTAIASFRFDASSPESKTGLIALYTEVFLKPFDIGCGACYHDAWQKLLKWKRNNSKEQIQTFMSNSKYKFKTGYPKNGKVTIRIEGSLVNITPQTLNDATAETLLSTPYAYMIEENNAVQEKKSEPITLKVTQPASTLTVQHVDGSEQKENVKEPELKLEDLAQQKEATQKAEPLPVKTAIGEPLKKRGRPAKVTS